MNFRFTASGIKVSTVDLIGVDQALGEELVAHALGQRFGESNHMFHASLPFSLERQVLFMFSRPPRRPTIALAPIASTNRTISMAYMRGMSKVL